MQRYAIGLIPTNCNGKMMEYITFINQTQTGLTFSNGNKMKPALFVVACQWVQGGNAV
jgi:hypothetical protein